MGAEYVRFAQSEASQGQRNFLESQAHLLTGIKQFKSYRLLRADELKLKITLKQQCDALAEQLAILDRLLPQTEFKLPTTRTHPSSPTQSSSTPSSPHMTREPTIEDELALIQKKLRALQ